MDEVHQLIAGETHMFFKQVKQVQVNALALVPKEDY